VNNMAIITKLEAEQMVIILRDTGIITDTDARFAFQRIDKLRMKGRI